MLAFNKKKILKTLLLILAIPVVFMALTIIGEIIFNLGQQLGTFLREMYNIVVCKNY